MKPRDPHSIRQRVATLFSAAPMSLIVIAVIGIAAFVPAFCILPFPLLLRFAASFAQAGIVIGAAVGLWSAVHQKKRQDRRRSIRIRRRD